MRPIAKNLAVLLALLFLSSLWVYQLPRSSVRLGFMTVYAPLQRIFYTNRRYRMYAPDPRARKLRPDFLTVWKPDRTVIYNFQDASLIGLHLNPLSRERWGNFTYHLTKSYLGEWSIYPPRQGQAVFARLGTLWCAHNQADRPRRLELRVEAVSFDDFLQPLQWSVAESLASYACPTGGLQ